MTNIEKWNELKNEWYDEYNSYGYCDCANIGASKEEIEAFWIAKIETLLQSEQARIAEEVEKKKGYWQVRFEGVSDGQERMHNKHYNESFSDIKDQVLDIVLSIIKNSHHERNKD